MTTFFYTATEAMFVIGFFVFVILYFVDAGYGKFRSNKWGYSINNKLGWFLMEFPALVPAFYYLLCQAAGGWEYFLIGIYAVHYVYRSLVFPFLLKGNSRMPIAIVLMGAVFNTINSTLIGFYTVSAESEPVLWLFPIGLLLFGLGMYTHVKADHTIRNLRKPGDTNHYLPKGGMFNYVTSANYFGELLEWTGYALMLNNPAGWMFVWWTDANLVPRSHAIHKKYLAEFGDEAVGKRKRIIPFVY